MGSIIFFKCLLCSPRLHLFDQNTVKTIMLCNIIIMVFKIFEKVCFPVMTKLNFTQQSLLKSSVSHDPPGPCQEADLVLKKFVITII